MSQNVTLPAIISAAQSRRNATAAPMKEEDRKMKAEDSQQQCLAGSNPTQNRQVGVVYKRSNFAGKPPFLATFGDARRAFQAAIQAQHVVAAT
jgi:hypothetical protein